METKPKLTIVTAALNESVVLPTWIKAVTNAMHGLKFDMVIVDDGSTDETWDIIKEQAIENPNIHGIQLSRNFGQQAALTAGLEKAYELNAEAVALTDCDMQDSPDDILKMYHELSKNDFDIIIGKRSTREGSKLFLWLYKLFYLIMVKISDHEIDRDAGDFCIMSRKVLQKLCGLQERNRFIRGLRTWVGFRRKILQLNRKERAAGIPSYSAKKLIELALAGITSHSIAPLRLGTILGVFMNIFALILILFTVLQNIFKPFFSQIGLPPVPGLSVILILMLVLGGIQLISLGLIGEYIGKIYNEVKQRPIYIINEEV